MAKEESDILNRWRLKWARWAILFRNNVGTALAGREVRRYTENGKEYVVLESPYRIAFGLMKGSGDFIGWRSVTVTPEMVGKKVAIFTSIEGKTADGRVSDDQRIWTMNVRMAGGIANVIRDPNQIPADWEPHD